jgi:hypothetical protein
MDQLDIGNPLELKKTEEEIKMTDDETKIKKNIKDLNDISSQYQKKVNKLLDTFDRYRSVISKYKLEMPSENVATHIPPENLRDIKSERVDLDPNDTKSKEKFKEMYKKNIGTDAEDKIEMDYFKSASLLHKLSISDNIDLITSDKGHDKKKISGWSQKDRLEFILKFADIIWEKAMNDKKQNEPGADLTNINIKYLYRYLYNGENNEIKWYINRINNIIEEFGFLVRDKKIEHYNINSVENMLNDEFNLNRFIIFVRKIVKYIIEDNLQTSIYNDIYNDSFKTNIYSNDYLITTDFDVPIELQNVSGSQGGGKIRTIKKNRKRLNKRNNKRSKQKMKGGAYGDPDDDNDPYVITFKEDQVEFKIKRSLNKIMDFDIDIFLENIIYLNREFNNICILPTIDYLINRNIVNINKENVLDLEKTLSFKPDGYFTEIGNVITNNKDLLLFIQHIKIDRLTDFFMNKKFENKINKILSIDKGESEYYPFYENLKKNIEDGKYNFLNTQNLPSFLLVKNIYSKNGKSISDELRNFMGENNKLINVLSASLINYNSYWTICKYIYSNYLINNVLPKINIPDTERSFIVNGKINFDDGDYNLQNIYDLLKLLSCNDEFLRNGKQNLNIRFFGLNISSGEITIYDNISEIKDLKGSFKQHDSSEIKIDISKFSTIDLFKYLSKNSDLSINIIDSNKTSNIIYGFINEKYFIEDLINLISLKRIIFDDLNKHYIDITLVDLLSILTIDPILEGGDEDLYEPIDSYKYSSLSGDLGTQNSSTDKFKKFMDIIGNVNVTENYSIENEELFRDNKEIKDIYPILPPKLINSDKSFKKNIINITSGLFDNRNILQGGSKIDELDQEISDEIFSKQKELLILNQDVKLRKIDIINKTNLLINNLIMFYGLIYKKPDTGGQPGLELNNNHKLICKIMNDNNNKKKNYIKNDLIKTLVINMDNLTNKILNVEIDENMINKILSSGPKNIALYLGKIRKKNRIKTRIKSAINKLGNFNSDLSEDMREENEDISLLEQKYNNNQELRYKKQIINENILEIFNLDIKDFKPEIKDFMLLYKNDFVRYGRKKPNSFEWLLTHICRANLDFKYESKFDENLINNPYIGEIYYIKGKYKNIINRLYSLKLEINKVFFGSIQPYSRCDLLNKENLTKKQKHFLLLFYYFKNNMT